MGQFDDMTTEELHRKMAGQHPSFAPYTDIALEIRRRDKEESKKRDDELKRRNDEASYRAWLSIWISLGSLLIALVSVAVSRGWFH